MQVTYWRMRNWHKEFYIYSYCQVSALENLHWNYMKPKGYYFKMGQQIPQVEVVSLKKQNCHCMSQAQVSRRKQIQWHRPEKNVAMAAEPKGSQSQSRQYQPWGSLPTLNCWTSPKHCKLTWWSHEQPPPCLKLKINVKPYWPRRLLASVPLLPSSPSPFTSAADSTDFLCVWY